MSRFILPAFTGVPHTLIIERAEYTPWNGERWHYELYCAEQLIFSGDDLGGPPGATEDEMARSAIGFLTLRPGDTDDEYFGGYSEEQCAWRDEYAEELSMILYSETGEEVPDLSKYRA